MNNFNIAIWGLGVTGKASLNYFLNSKNFSDINLTIDVYDGAVESNFRDFIKSISTNDKFEKINFNFETNNLIDIKNYDLIMISPSVSENHPDIIEARENNITIHNDVSYFISEWQKTGKKSVGVTGSNGKSTVVSLIHGSLLSAGTKTILVGNIGKSPLDYLLDYEEGKLELDIPVIELSSYQLESFSPETFTDIAVITNISPNHLDHHNNSMEEYVGAKLKIAGLSTKIITVTDDPGIQQYVLPKIKEFVPVSLENISPDLEKFVPEESRTLKGQHNLYNIAMTLEVLQALDIDITLATDFIKNYSGLEHRIEFVREIDGVKYINDSKSTSPDATRVALEAFGDFKNIVLIAGGNDKKVSFESLKDPINQYVKYLVIFNHDINQKFIDIAEKFEIPHQVADDLSECVKIAKENSSAGDVILFSPAAASLGKFNNFEHRGEVFKEVVNNIEK